MIFFEFPEVFRGCKVEIPLIERCRLCLARDLLTDAELARGSSTGTSRLLVHSSRRRHHPGIKSDSANFCKNKRKQAPNGVLALSRKNNNRTNHKHERETNETVQKKKTNPVSNSKTFNLPRIQRGNSDLVGSYPCVVPDPFALWHSRACAVMS